VGVAKLGWGSTRLTRRCTRRRRVSQDRASGCSRPLDDSDSRSRCLIFPGRYVCVPAELPTVNSTPWPEMDMADLPVAIPAAIINVCGVHWLRNAFLKKSDPLD
jgi:hypothetical protein